MKERGISEPGADEAPRNIVQLWRGEPRVDAAGAAAAAALDPAKTRPPLTGRSDGGRGRSLMMALHVITKSPPAVRLRPTAPGKREKRQSKTKS
ncbi:hypothetical protein EYF80_016975 [Liparis tanakae]|uniref:Uncharacterized protein n=1 Tax=Liparis tanakae TaxID=230148 RepID=A0A4Z2I6C1_9TELE|nr:hypothetical protein EYF80_016975 [Liparis tanakae]